MRAADSTRTSFEASSSSREAPSADETSRTPLGTFGGSPSGDERVREPTVQFVAGSATTRGARAGSHRDRRSRRREGARSPREPAGRPAWTSSRARIAGRARQDCPGNPRPSPKNCTPPCRGSSAPGREGAFRKRGRPPQRAGAARSRTSFHGSQTLDRRNPQKKSEKQTQDTERPKSERTFLSDGAFIRRPRKKKYPDFFFALALQAESGRDRCHTNCDESSVFLPLLTTSRLLLGARSFPSLLSPSLSFPPLPSPSLSFPPPLKKNVLTRCNWARVPSRRRCSPTVPT